MTNARPWVRSVGLALRVAGIGLMLHNGELFAQSAAGGNVTFNSNGAPANFVSNDGSYVVNVVYNSNGSTSKVVDNYGNVIDYVYNSDGTLSKAVTTLSNSYYEMFGFRSRVYNYVYDSDGTNSRCDDFVNNNGTPTFTCHVRAFVAPDPNKIGQQLVKESPLSAFNNSPASMQSDMSSGAYDVGTDRSLDSLPSGSSFSVGARFGSYGLDKYTQNVYTIPMSYTYTFRNHDNLVVQLPLSYIDVEGSSAYRGMLSISYRKKISSRWVLTPSLGYGIAGSNDLGSLGYIVSGSLTSDLMLYDRGNVSLSMGNMVGYYVSMPVRIDNYKVNTNLYNTITRDGLILSIPLTQELWGRQLSVDIFATGTWFFGDVLYNDKFQEYGITIGPRRSAGKRAPNASSQSFGFGLSYIHGGKGDSGFKMNFTYRF